MGLVGPFRTCRIVNGRKSPTFRTLRCWARTFATEDEPGNPRLPCLCALFTASHFIDVRTVDDQFALGDANGKRQANVSPGDRVAVLLVNDAAFDIDHAVLDHRDVVRRGRQHQQVRLFLGVLIDGPLLGLPMDTLIGGLRQPASGHRVEVFNYNRMELPERILGNTRHE